MKNIQNKILQLSIALFICIPRISFGAFQGVKDLLGDFKEVLDLIIPITFALALIFFFWGLAQFIRSISDKTIAEGKNKMIWGIIALFVMISIWGIIKYIGESLDIETGIQSGTGTSGSGSGFPCIPGNDPSDPTCGG